MITFHFRRVPSLSLTPNVTKSNMNFLEIESCIRTELKQPRTLSLMPFRFLPQKYISLKI